MSFLPTTYTKIPTSSNYLKFQDGDNNFRVLSSAVVGYQYWNIERKPVRARENWNFIPADMQFDENGGFKINHFWAFTVWNYDEQKIQILEVTQKQIMKALKALVDNAKWGDPKGYDITITRSGKGFDTEYIVQPSPHSPLDEKVAKLYAETNINLEALFDGNDPFMASNGSVAPDIAEDAAQLDALDALVGDNQPEPSGYEKFKAAGSR